MIAQERTGGCSDDGKLVGGGGEEGLVSLFFSFNYRNNLTRSSQPQFIIAEPKTGELKQATEGRSAESCSSQSSMSEAAEWPRWKAEHVFARA